MDKHIASSSSFGDQESLTEHHGRPQRKYFFQWWSSLSRSFQVTSILILFAALVGIIVGIAVPVHSHWAAEYAPVLAAPLSSDKSNTVISTSLVSQTVATGPVRTSSPVSSDSPMGSEIQTSSPSSFSPVDPTSDGASSTAVAPTLGTDASGMSPSGTSASGTDPSGTAVVGFGAEGNADMRLRFTNDGTFQISTFNDLHFGEDNPGADVKTTGVMNSILDSESSAQLVVLNGDLITGDGVPLETSTSYLDTIVAPLVQRNALWASTYGNHDNSFTLSTHELLKKESTYSNSLTKDMIGNPDAGTSNYYLPVYGNKGGAVPILLLWFFDSRGGTAYQQADANGPIGVEGVVHDATTQWFIQTQHALKSQYGRVVPSLAFVHIPVNAMASFQKTGVDANKEPGINGDPQLSPQGVWKDEYTGSDIPFMSALLNTQGLMAVFSGHDHGNDWCNKWDRQYPDMSLAGNGLFLCFGRHSGYGGYGSWMRGSRQILLHEAALWEVHTWIRLEDKSISGSVVLNGTYGQDSYPAVEDRQS